MLVKNYARAEQVWATWLCNSKERLSFQKLTSHLARSSDTDMGMKLLEFIENQPHTSTLVKGVIYGHVINALGWYYCLEAPFILKNVCSILVLISSRDFVSSPEQSRRRGFNIVGKSG